MRRPFDNIFPCKQPVSPAETAHVVECLEEQDYCLFVLHGELANTDFFSFLADMFQECAVWQRSVIAEFMQDLGQWCGGHRNLEEVVEKRDLFLYVHVSIGWLCLCVG
jgi:hypothetical protein